MDFEEISPEEMWGYYQKGYLQLVSCGRFFRQVVRPALSHVYFHKAMPLLKEYSRANHGMGDLPPGFGDQMEAHSLTARDLLHLDYAISLGYSQSLGFANAPILNWPGPDLYSTAFLAADIKQGAASPDPEGTGSKKEPRSEG